MQPVLIPPEAGRRQGMGWTTGGLEVESNFKPDRPLPHAPSPEKNTGSVSVPGTLSGESGVDITDYMLRGDGTALS